MSHKVIKSANNNAGLFSPFEYPSLGNDSPKAAEPTEPDWTPMRVPSPAAVPPPPVVAVPPLPPQETLDLTAIQKKAFEEGFLQGEKAGHEMGERQTEAVLKRFADSIAELGRLRKTVYQQVEREVIKLALAIAKKIVLHEVQTDMDIALTLVRVAMKNVSEKTPVTIRLNATDYHLIMKRKSELVSESDESRIVLQPDGSIDRGGCLIETDCGTIDARIEEQFKEIEKGLLEIAPPV
jgi:flagellar assembly protein FliH